MDVDDPIEVAWDYFRRGEISKATEMCRRLRRVRDDPAKLLILESILMEANGEPVKATDMIRRCAYRYLDDAAVQNDVAILLKRWGRTELALEHYQAAIRLDDSMPLHLVNYANLQEELGLRPQAEINYRRALSLDPTISGAHYALGRMLRHARQLTEAAEHFEEAIRFDEQNADAHFLLGMTLLELGELPRGFDEYEWRWQSRGFLQRQFPGREWRSGNIDGLRLLVHAEQGFGDTIQFARYLPMLKACGATILLVCDPAIAPLMRRLESVDQVFTDPVIVGEFDQYVSIMSLAERFNTDRSTIPAEFPDVFTPSSSAPPAWTKLVSKTHINIGICWAGSLEHPGDKQRSCQLSNLLQLSAVPALNLISLQRDPRPHDYQHLSAITELGIFIHDFGDTAQMIGQMDVIVSVDTAVAHLAGAMGKPVYLLLSEPAEWRWGLERETSPWYPTMKLIRQESAGDWDSVVQRVPEVLGSDQPLRS